MIFYFAEIDFYSVAQIPQKVTDNIVNNQKMDKKLRKSKNKGI